MVEISTDIITKASEGNIEAFEEIYKATSGFVYCVALRVVNNQSDAEEVTQDVFIAIYRNLNRFQFRSSFKTWVYRIAVNTAINAYRRISKEMKRRGGCGFPIENRHAAPTTEEVLQKKENEERIVSLLAMLNPDQRACITLKEIEGLSYKEIAEVLNININTVRSRLKRARETLLAQKKSGVIENEL